MSSVGHYLYCIVRGAEELTFEGAVPVGGADGPVRTVPCGSLAGVVSDASTAGYECTRAHMLAHQRVLERVMRAHTLLPVRFGTVADSAQPSHQVQRLLAKRSSEFDRLLAEMEGKVELGLKASWRDERVLFQEVAAQDEGIRRLRDAIQGKAPEATRFDRVRLGEMVRQGLERKRHEEAAGILAPLRPLAVRTVENRVLVDRMIVNAAFLVDRAREQDFDWAVSELDARLGQRVAFSYAGPVPPYNFVNVVVNWQEL